MEIRKISIDQGQEQTSSLVWYLSRKRLHTGVGLLFGLGSFRNLHSNDESSTSLCLYTTMFWDIFISWWFLLYVFALVFRGVGTGYLSANENSLIETLCRWAMIGCVLIVAFSFKYIPWWATLVMFPLGWIVAMIMRLILTPILLPMSSNKAESVICSILADLATVGSLILFMISKC